MKFLSCCRLTILAVTTLLLGACTSIDGVSREARFPAATQYKVKSAAHWQLIAQDVAAHMAAALRDQPQVAVFLPDDPYGTVFSRVFTPMLRSALMARGAEVSTRPDGAAELKVAVEKVSHAPVYRAGTITVLGSGLLVLRDIVLHNSYNLVNAGAVVGVMGADMAVARHGPPPEFELVLSTSLQRASQLLAAKTDVYYLAADDVQVYEKRTGQPPTAREFPVVGAGAQR